MAKFVIGNTKIKGVPAFLRIKEPSIDSLSITPTTREQIITAPSGTDGYSPITVNAVTSAIDNNIVAGNIKDGISILGVTGNYTGATPTSYLEYNIDSNGELTKWTSLSTLGSFKIIGEKTLMFLLASTSDITTVSFNDVEIIKSTGLGSFGQTSSLTTMNLPKLTDCKYAALTDFCRNNSNFTTLNIPSLKNIDGYVFSNAFRNTGITILKFSALKTIDNSGFNTFLIGTTGVEVHFPKNLDPQTGSTVISSLSGYPSFSGTNTVLLFDLPSAVDLTGANSVVYERSPKDDTVSALAWRINQYGSNGLVVDWTPYYTNTLNDPTVGDTIYSDSACTTAVTTISSIA